ncbi:MAG: hypothetical protein M0D57_11435 [Sphingobacteriales bacterium JAD_PAG50586_3]|nr:MAG: hypothetical protein M0D57_11435 [Sphingobacteriales bacterium JAD_PAG50586_3]
MRNLLFLLLSATFYGCALPEGWEKIDAEGLPENTMFSNVVFADDSVGYAATVIPKMSVHKTTNGGKNWTKIPLNGQDASVRQMYAFKGSLVVLVQTFRELSDYILRYDNGSWDTIYQSKDGFDIHNMYFEEPAKGFAVLGKSSSSQKPVLISLKGKAIDTLNEIQYEYRNSYFTKDTVYSFQQHTPSNSYIATSLVTGNQYLHKFEKRLL